MIKSDWKNLWEPKYGEMLTAGCNQTSLTEQPIAYSVEVWEVLEVPVSKKRFGLANGKWKEHESSPKLATRVKGIRTVVR